MNGYSKMRPSNKKTRSMDFLDLLSSPPPTQETNPNTNPKSPERISDESSVVKNKINNQHPDSPPKVDELDVNIPRSTTVVGDVKSMGTCSVASSTSSHPCRFRLERQISSRRTTLQSGVKRVFSMRRSSSVSEKYCRIYDQHLALEPDDGGDGDAEGTDNNEMKTRSIKTKKNNHIGILKVCRRFLGF